MVPRISIIMAAYNAAEFIKESVDSVLAQSYHNWELVIIDDGSTDNTGNIAKQYLSQDNRIKYYYQENSKQGKARNLGISKSNGDIVAFLDTDDLWLPEKLAISLAKLEESNCDLLFTDSYFFTNSIELNNVPSLNRMGVVTGDYKGKKGFTFFLQRNRIPLLTVLVKKNVLVAVGCFRNRGFAEDYELWLNLLASGYYLKGIDLPLSIYRVHPNASTYSDPWAINGVAWMLNNFFKEYSELKSENKPLLKVWLKRYILHHALSGTKNLKFPDLFNEFKKHLTPYKLLLKSKKVLRARAFNYLMHKVYGE